VSRLRVAATEGRLDADELEDRVAAAFGAKRCVELEEIVADVTPAPAPPPPVFVTRSRRVNPLAAVALVAGLLWIGWVGSVAAVICGHWALAQIRAAHGRESGRGLAIAGLALGYLGLLTLMMSLLAAVAFSVS
jgi:hypothetical protein